MNKIQEITRHLKADLEKVDEIILQFSVGKSPLIKEISHHLISSGGKRIRPILLILATKLCDEKAREFHNLAAAVELIHSATLLHDDVVDDSKTRRGNKTANAIWNNKVSILVGDYLFSVAFQLMVKSDNIKILDLLAKTSSIMADGEVLQLENSSNIEIEKEKYFDIIFGKTAVLFSAATETGALFCNESSTKTSALKDFGKNLGIIFQIIDDTLDYLAVSEEFGKEIGGDFFEGKITLPIILTYAAADVRDKEIIKNLFEENLIAAEKSQKSLKKILELMYKYNALQKCEKIIDEYKNLAIKNLSIFNDSIYKEYLIEILNYSMARKK